LERLGFVVCLVTVFFSVICFLDIRGWFGTTAEALGKLGRVCFATVCLSVVCLLGIRGWFGTTAEALGRLERVCLVTVFIISVISPQIERIELMVENSGKTWKN
jgi:hypothetical protein